MPPLQRVKSQSALKATQSSSADGLRGRSPDRTSPADTSAHPGASRLTSRAPAAASGLLRDLDGASDSDASQGRSSAAAAGNGQRQGQAPPHSPRGLTPSTRSSTALLVLQQQQQQNGKEEESEEQHPRGHLTWQKRCRFVLLRTHRLMASPRVQLLVVGLACILLLGLLSGRSGGGGKEGGGGRRRGGSVASRQNRKGWRYAVYIDGGSSGTRAHVFRYTAQPWPAYVQLDLPEKAMSVEPGLSSYAGRPEQAAESLQPLVEFALGHVPQQLWDVTPVYLLATAGLRLLTPTDATDILDACSRALAATPLVHHRRLAEVIPGDAEGVYAWAAANYVVGALEETAVHAHHRVRKELSTPDLYQGVLELGGASFQVTFMPRAWGEGLAGGGGGGGSSTGMAGQGHGPAGQGAEVSVGSQLIHLPGVSQRLFTHSYLGLGMDSAMQKAADLVQHVHQQRWQQRRRRHGGGNGGGAVTHAAGGDGGHDAHDSLDSKETAGAEERHDKEEGEEEGVVWDPCLPSGYQTQDGRMGNSSFDGCLAVVQQVLPALQCDSAAATGTGTGTGTGPHSHSHQQEKQRTKWQQHQSGHGIHGRGQTAASGGQQPQEQEQLRGVGSEEEVAVEMGANAGGGAGARDAESESGRHRGEEGGEEGMRLQGGAESAQGKGQRRGQQAQHGRHLSGGVGDAAATAAAGRGLCTFAGVHVPEVSGTTFIALENFFWTARALGLPSRSTLAELRQAGTAHCALDWSVLHDRFAGHVPDQFITRYCFGAAYVYALLRDRLGIADTQRSLVFTNTVRRKRRRRAAVEEEGDERPATGGIAEEHGSDGRAPQDGVAPSATQSPDERARHQQQRHAGDGAASSSGGKDKEVEVSLSWVLGAVLVHAMEADRQGGTAQFMDAAAAVASAGRGDGMEDEVVGAQQAASSVRWMVLLPVALCLLLVARVWSSWSSSGGSGRSPLPGALFGSGSDGPGPLAVRLSASQQQLWPLPWSEAVRAPAPATAPPGQAPPPRVALAVDVRGGANAAPQAP